MLLRAVFPVKSGVVLSPGNEPEEGADVSGYEAWQEFIRAARDTGPSISFKDRLKAFLRVLISVPIDYDFISTQMRVPPQDREAREAWNKAAAELSPGWILVPEPDGDSSGD